MIPTRPMGASLVVVVILLAGCSSGDAGSAPSEAGRSTSVQATTSSAEQRFPEIVGVKLTPRGGRTFDVDVTVSSAYDTPERYADGWRVTGTGGEVLGTHELTHDHQSEQPFTRTQTGLTIPGGITQVTVQGRDQRYGFGGKAATVPVPNGS